MALPGGLSLVLAPAPRCRLAARFAGRPEFAKEPESIGQDDSIAALLDEAEDIVNMAGPRIFDEVAAEHARTKGLRAKMRGRSGKKQRKKRRRRN